MEKINRVNNQLCDIDDSQETTLKNIKSITDVAMINYVGIKKKKKHWRLMTNVKEQQRRVKKREINVTKLYFRIHREI